MTTLQKSQQILVEKTNSLRYLITEFDQNGWADATKFRPIPFDLVTVETHSGKKLCGWWTLVRWDGLYLKSSDSVLKWKRRRYDHIA